MLFGSNEERYWLVVKPEIDTLWWGRHDPAVPPRAEDLTFRPDLIVEALGLNPLPAQSAKVVGPAQRITKEHQQLLFWDYDDQSRGYVAKEYWLSGYGLRLVDRIIFRDPMGRMVMDTHLSDYRPIGEDGPVVAHRVEVDWPASDSRMVFTTSGWKVLPEVDATHPGFTFPLELDESFTRIVDIDTELDNIHNPLRPSEYLLPSE
jgi:hypothetical protein